MKRAIEVIANVQIVLALVVISSPPLVVVSDYFLDGQKKRTGLLLAAALDEPLGPGLVGVEQLHRRDHVEEHPEGEEVRDLLGRQPGDALGVVDECAEAAADDRADLLVVTGRVGLHLTPQPVRVLDDHPRIGLADRVERLLPGEPGGGFAEHLERLLEAALARRDEELLLRPEEPEQVRLRDPDAPGDGVGRRAGEAVLGELDQRRLEDLLTAYLGGLAFNDRSHGRDGSDHSLPCQAGTGFRSLYQAIVRGRPSWRSTCGSPPSSLRAFPTFPIPISTSTSWSSRNRISQCEPESPR